MVQVNVVTFKQFTIKAILEKLMALQRKDQVLAPGISESKAGRSLEPES